MFTVWDSLFTKVQNINLLPNPVAEKSISVLGKYNVGYRGVGKDGPKIRIGERAPSNVFSGPANSLVQPVDTKGTTRVWCINLFQVDVDLCMENIAWLVGPICEAFSPVFLFLKKTLHINSLDAM